MKIAKTELLMILKKLKPAVDTKKRHVTSQGDCFIFNEDTIVSFNEEIAIIYPLETGIKCAVPADELYKFAMKAKGKDIILIHDNNTFSLTSGKSKSVLIIPEVDNTIHDAIETLNIPSKFMKLPENFIEGIKLCLHSVSKDISDEGLSCININGDKIYSSDDFRISEFIMESSVKKQFLLYGPHASYLQKYNPLKYYKTENWIYFLLDDNSVFCSRVIANFEYPDISDYFEFKGKRVVLPKDLTEAVEVAAITSADNDKIFGEITVKIEDGTITCVGENVKGKSWKKTDIDFEGSAEFVINPDFLIKILKITSEIKIGKDRCLFVTNNFQQLFSLKQ